MRQQRSKSSLGRAFAENMQSSACRRARFGSVPGSNPCPDQAGSRCSELPNPLNANFALQPREFHLRVSQQLPEGCGEACGEGLRHVLGWLSQIESLKLRLVQLASTLVERSQDLDRGFHRLRSLALTHQAFKGREVSLRGLHGCAGWRLDGSAERGASIECFESPAAGLAGRRRSTPPPLPA